MAEPQPLIRAHEVLFGYGREVVLEDVSLDVRRGDFLAIIGPNGGGKTTLLRLFLNLERPWSGRIERRLSRPGSIGFVPQVAGSARSLPLRVADVVAMGRLGSRGLGRRYVREDRDAVIRALAICRLEKEADAPIFELSTGQLQRALIARAVVAEPEVLILDEPLASADPAFRGVFKEVLETLGSDLTVVVVTHDLTPLATEVRQIACLNRHLYYHPEGQLSSEMLHKVYGCPVELVAHGVPHRVLPEHPGETSG
jgi:zinc transport system ATP-binding protein